MAPFEQIESGWGDTCGFHVGWPWHLLKLGGGIRGVHLTIILHNFNTILSVLWTLNRCILKAPCSWHVMSLAINNNRIRKRQADTEKSFQRREFCIWPCAVVGVGGPREGDLPTLQAHTFPWFLFAVLCLTLLRPFPEPGFPLFLFFWSDFSGLARVGGQQLLDGVGWGPGIHSPSISGSERRVTVLLTPRLPNVGVWTSLEGLKACWAGLPSSTQHPASKRAVALSSPLLLLLFSLSLSLDLLKKFLFLPMLVAFGEVTLGSPTNPTAQGNSFHWNLSSLSGIRKFLSLDLLEAEPVGLGWGRKERYAVWHAAVSAQAAAAPPSAVFWRQAGFWGSSCEMVTATLVLPPPPPLRVSLLFPKKKQLYTFTY